MRKIILVAEKTTHSNFGISGPSTNFRDAVKVRNENVGPLWSGWAVRACGACNVRDRKMQ